MMSAKSNTLLVLLILFTFLLSSISYAKGTNESLPEFISNALSNPKVLIAIGVQFALGLALGYFSVKVLKYILALVGVLILGSILSVWSLGGDINELISSIGVEVQKVLPLIKSIISALGILTIGPVAVGFLVGVIIGSIRK